MDVPIAEALEQSPESISGSMKFGGRVVRVFQVHAEKLLRGVGAWGRVSGVKALGDEDSGLLQGLRESVRAQVERISGFRRSISRWSSGCGASMVGCGQLSTVVDQRGSLLVRYSMNDISWSRMSDSRS